MTVLNKIKFWISYFRINFKLYLRKVTTFIRQRVEFKTFIILSSISVGITSGLAAVALKNIVHFFQQEPTKLFLAIGLPHEVKGNAIHTFVILKTGYQKRDKLIEELRQRVGHEVGPIAKPEHIEVVDSLPKTRSGKIMRRVLKARALGIDPGNLSTLEE